MVQRALILGVNGFVGGYLTAELKEQGYEVFGADIAEASANKVLDGYRAVDITDPKAVAEAFAEFQPDAIVNLAAVSSVGLSWRDPQATVRVNVIGALNVLDAARDMEDPPKVLLIGSSEEYAPSSRPLKETDTIDATNPYGISKMAQERTAEVYEQRYGLRIYRTRSFNHTGVGQSCAFVLPSWCKQVAEIERSGKPGVLKVGNLDVRRDFSDVRDVVRAYRLLLESDRHGEVFNVGSGKAFLLENLAEMVVSFSTQHVEIALDSNLRRPVDNPIICCDATKADEAFGWRAKLDLRKTLREMYEHFLLAN